jgi:SUMO ligase MMS21 Smc5/6 complex component
VKKVAGLQLLKGSSKCHHMVLTATDKNEEEDETGKLVVEQDLFDDRLHIHIHSHLFPLLIHKDKIVLMTDLWNPNHTAQQVKEVLLSIVPYQRFNENGRQR